MDIYQPAEDSYLLEESVKKHARGEVLEIGTGSGILAIAAAKNSGTKVTAIDINKKAIDVAKENSLKEKTKIKFIQSDLFEKVPRKKFNTIIFNPPYLPQDEGIKDDVIYGGKKGHETIERFLAQSVEFLSSDGIILLLFSSLTGKEKVEKMITDLGLEFSQMSSKKEFFESLYVYEIRKTKLLKELEEKRVVKIQKFAKGHRGMIFIGQLKGKKIAVKAERKDTTKKGSIGNEIKWLKKINKKGIGPKIVFFGEDYFAYKFIEGERILDYLAHCNKNQAVKIFNDTLRQCLVLDKMMISKEEMHYPRKHILVEKEKAVLIDFERCHRMERPKNVTQFLQFVSTPQVLKLLDLKGIRTNPQTIRAIAANYRKTGKIQ